MGVLAPTNGPVTLLTHTGPPVTGDGIFTKGSQAMDTSDVLYVCTASGTPGTWVTVTAGGGGSVSSVFTRTGAVVAASGDYSVGQVTGAAPLASPAFTGSPTAPTQTPGDNTTKIATDAFVAAAIAPLAPLASPALTGSPTAPTQTPGDNTTKIATDAFVAAAIASLAPLASPALTGSPTAPTQTPGDNTTKIATDAFVATAITNATLAILAAVYPIGSTYIETTGQNPAITFGFGTWAAFAPGQVLIGVGTFTDGDGNSQTITNNQQLGEYKHTLTAAESGLPSHAIPFNLGSNSVNSLNGDYLQGTTYASGGGLGSYSAVPSVAAANAANAHNNIQPSYGVYIWHRTL